MTRQAGLDRGRSDPLKLKPLCQHPGSRAGNAGKRLRSPPQTGRLETQEEAMCSLSPEAAKKASVPARRPLIK